MLKFLCLALCLALAACAPDPDTAVTTGCPDLPQTPDHPSSDTAETAVETDVPVVDAQDASDASVDAGEDGSPDVIIMIADATSDATSDVPMPPPGAHIVRSLDGRGDFWFCGSYEGHDPRVYGYRGCCTNGRWYSQEDFGRAPGFYAGTSVRGTASEVVYYIMAREDGSLARVEMPTSKILLSWSTHPERVIYTVGEDDPTECSTLYEADQAQLDALPLAGVALFRAGTAFTRREGTGELYIAGANRTLQMIRFRGSTSPVPPSWFGLSFYEHPLPASLFERYAVSATVVEVEPTDVPVSVLGRYRSEESFVSLFR